MGRKALKRKLGKKVLSGKMTVDEARGRLGRQVAQKSAGSAWSTWPQQQPAYQPREPDWEYAMEAARTQLPRPSPPVITKAQQAAQRRYDEQMAPVRAAIAKALAPDPSPLPAPRQPAVVKQLTQPERATVAGLERHLERVAGDPAQRERIKDQIAQITGLPYTGVV